MKKLLQILRLPPGTEEACRTAHHIWLTFALTGLGCCTGVLALMFSATAYAGLPSKAIFLAYFQNPLILFLNLLPPVLLVWLFYFLSRRAWVGFLGSFLPVMGLALVNYYKIRLRSDPLFASDLRLAAEAGGIVGNYQLDVTWLHWFALFCLTAGLLFAILLMPRGLRGRRGRAFGALSCLALAAVSFVSLYTDPQVYRLAATSCVINQLSEVEVYVSKGGLYPFLYSIPDMFPSPPEGYDAAQAAALLAQYTDEDIPEDKKVSVMGIMLEAFCDLTDFEALAAQEAAAQVYAPWHALEEQSVSGDLLTNIFAGGTVDSEWGFLTGYTAHGEFRKPADSYVWYLKGQGYQTFGSHPGFQWFYNRQNVNQYLGFDEYWYSENHYAPLVDPVSAIYDSDHLLARELLDQLEQRAGEGPCFSFSVSYQNHGPYETGRTLWETYLTPEGTGWAEETCNIWNNYLHGVADTIGAMVELTQGLEALDEPVVLVLFGDHKPWGGNDGSAYTWIGADFSLSSLDSFYDYYSTPYLIWANSAAKEVLDCDFTGDGGDFSPCFLMDKVFDLCGWEGPGFMQLSRQVRTLTPLVHDQGLYLKDGQLTAALPGEEAEFLDAFLQAQYCRETGTVPGT